MNKRTSQPLYPNTLKTSMNTNRSPASNARQYILFTWTKCKQCQELKRNLVPHLQSGRIKEYDLDAIRTNNNLMGVFNRISPNRNVPAMAIVSNGILESGAVGVSDIMRVL